MSDFVQLMEELEEETKNKSPREIRWMIRVSHFVSLLYNPSFFYTIVSFVTFFMSVIFFSAEEMLKVSEIIFFVIAFHFSFRLALFLFQPLDTREEHEKFKAISLVLKDIYHSRYVEDNNL